MFSKFPFFKNLGSNWYFLSSLLRKSEKNFECTERSLNVYLCFRSSKNSESQLEQERITVSKLFVYIVIQYMGNFFVKWSNLFAPVKYATLLEIVSNTPLKILTNECCFYCNKLFFVWINSTFLFRFSFVLVFVVFWSAVHELHTFRPKIQEKCNWATHSIKFKLKVYHQNPCIKRWNRVKLKKLSKFLWKYIFQVANKV